MIKNDSLTEKIIGCCYKVHNELGPGFNEKIYHNALESELEKTGLFFESEKEFKVNYGGKYVGKFRVDLVVENKVIVEIKAINAGFMKVFESQLVSYLKSSGLHTGLLVNFGNDSCKIKRMVF